MKWGWFILAALLVYFLFVWPARVRRERARQQEEYRAAVEQLTGAILECLETIGVTQVVDSVAVDEVSVFEILPVGGVVEARPDQSGHAGWTEFVGGEP